MCITTHKTIHKPIRIYTLYLHNIEYMCPVVIRVVQHPILHAYYKPLKFVEWYAKLARELHLCVYVYASVRT